MLKLCLPIISLLVVLASAAYSSEPAAHRVAGIVRQGDSWLFAIVEAPDGSCRTFSRGQVIDGAGTITDVTDTGIVVELNGVTRLLNLQGGTYVAAQGSSDASLILNREVIRDTLLSKLENVTGVKKPAPEPLTRRELNSLLEIPAEATITAINGKPVASPSDTASVAIDEVKKGLLVRVQISGIDGMEQIYIMPKGDNPVPPPGLR